AVRQKNVTVGIESEEVAKGLHGNDRTGDGFLFRYCLLHENLQGIPGTAAETGKKLSIVKKIPAEDFRDAEDEMSVGHLFEDIHAEPLAEFHHTLLMTGRAKVAALTREGK